MSLENLLGIPGGCRVGRTLLTMDWCYSHNRYVRKCLLQEEEMPRPLYPEHEMMPIPDSLLLCQRCKQGLIFTPNSAEPFCMKCGDSGRPGEVYIREAEVVNLLLASPLTPALALLSPLLSDAAKERLAEAGIRGPKVE